MTRVAFDTNILIYAEFEAETANGALAEKTLRLGGRNGVIPLQVLGELLRFAQRRRPDFFSRTVARAEHYRRVFMTPATTPSALGRAARLTSRYNIQFWDAVVCAASLEEEARVLMTEDMQDGETIGGLRLINPFDPANTDAINALFE